MDQRETPERERELRAQAALTEQTQTQIYSPWKARAIGRWPRDDTALSHPSDLQFNAGDIISVTSKHCDKWWTGAAHGRHGTFPRTLVQLLPPGTRDAEVRAIERQEAMTRTSAKSAYGAAAGTRYEATGVSSAGRVRHRTAVGGARTPHAQPPLALPSSDELARTFLLWDPVGSGGDHPPIATDPPNHNRNN